MNFVLEKLPFEESSLEPYISKETLFYHYQKHHKAYLDKLNALIEKSITKSKKIEDIIKTESGPVFNNAAQVYNHDFYWKSLSSIAGDNKPNNKILEKIKSDFGSFELFKKAFSDTAIGHFGSGWIWLVQDKNGQLAIENTQNADCPLKYAKNPILTCDVWEHAYYIDYRNERSKYIESWWNIVNWRFAANNLK